jgi:hypothetical protein
MRVAMWVCPEVGVILCDDWSMLEITDWLDEQMQSTDVEGAVFVGYSKDGNDYAIDLEGLEMLVVH